MQIYHNPRCSKSRQTLALLEGAGIDFEIVYYLENPPSQAQLKVLLKKLGIAPRDLLRKGEAEYKALGLDDTSLDDVAVIQAMSENPRLIERPIVVRGDRAIIGRPPESVNALLHADL